MLLQCVVIEILTHQASWKVKEVTFFALNYIITISKQDAVWLSLAGREAVFCKRVHWSLGWGGGGHLSLSIKKTFSAILCSSFNEICSHLHLVDVIAASANLIANLTIVVLNHARHGELKIPFSQFLALTNCRSDCLLHVGHFFPFFSCMYCHSWHSFSSLSPAAIEACLSHLLKRRAAGFLRSDKIAALFTKVGKVYDTAADVCRKVQEQLQQQADLTRLEFFPSHSVFTFSLIMSI